MDYTPWSPYDYSVLPSPSNSNPEASGALLETASFEDYPHDLGATQWDSVVDPFSSGTSELGSYFGSTFQGPSHLANDDGTVDEEPQIQSFTGNEDYQHEELAESSSFMVDPSLSYRSLAPSEQGGDYDSDDAEYTDGVPSIVQPAPDSAISDDESAAWAHSSSNLIHTEGLSPEASPEVLIMAVDSALTYDNSSFQSSIAQHRVDKPHATLLSTGFDGHQQPTSLGLSAELISAIAYNKFLASSTAQGSLDQGPPSESPSIPGAQFNPNDSQPGFPPMNTVDRHREAHPAINADYTYHTGPSSFHGDGLMQVSSSQLPQTEPTFTPGAPFNFNHSQPVFPPMNVLDYHSAVDSSIDANYRYDALPSSFHGDGFMQEPIASGSRHVLNDIQPGQEAGQLQHACAQFQNPAMGAVSDHENHSPTAHGRPVRRQPKSRANRKQLYNRKKKSTQLRRFIYAIPADVVFDMDTAKAHFRQLQEVVCPFPVNGCHCGLLVDSAEAMFDHLETHGVDHRKKKTVNAHLGGQCPLDDCGRAVGGGSAHRHLMEDFYKHMCPMGGCGKEYPRHDQIRAHCENSHSITMLGNWDFAVWKDAVVLR
ncbi:hypothetical protein M413DRAFT_32501 [Hebeloma cylindrosporum]|uniref:C2H2-type domain-containing protein n=1 Tax=Hebeloma cylindrosporum TaxID=76867 RepID=A0A0C3BFC2_HEBCY|nr:hypothetical protein M413DRAFT_32501 [Hebeloma cylindrosporum h7]